MADCQSSFFGHARKEVELRVADREFWWDCIDRYTGQEKPRLYDVRNNWLVDASDRPKS